MSEPAAIILFDDACAASWRPFSLTRPVGELLLGAFTGRQRASLVFGAPCAGHVAPHLDGFDEHDAAPVLTPDSLDRGPGRLYLSSRAVPAWHAELPDAKESALLLMGDDVVAWYCAPGAQPPPDEFFRDPARHAPDHLPRHSMAGSLLVDFWDLVIANPVRVEDDFRHAPSGEAASLPGSVAVLGRRADVRVGRRVTFEPHVVIDCTAGPVWVADDVTIRSFTRLAGPAWIGPHTTLLGGSVSGISAGPHCKLRGEIEASIMNGYTNKAHDGFIGHACIGRWVNLGALTTNSDLKNNYGSVRVRTHSGDSDTGEMKIGCFIGDHVRTAIGTLLNTGTVIGPGANVFGPAMPPKFVEPFAWGDSGEHQDIEKFLVTARTAMHRRGVTLSAGMESVLRAARGALR